ncbi:hypothetical protein SODALDRAFT_327303 [Sodiomyces alkalinus F11]|uniref:Coenzyme Q-binding protein COQ10 START domain-containing protein n=1 Tax=Sodiomyces alkalinus (strain CBS 110278 / VKM F-3762 / F11) TaxID=1314773 RepID=A0A3N2Q8Q0_SODAK|nr:hypothetical protein SODALDRAFT_327303 [Sodiomyces alkalinus F11]ROT43132.1 hypothetical protein SODALDRAFT_327303 [Sodiomyces alkalinus F11]
MSRRSVSRLATPLTHALSSLAPCTTPSFLFRGATTATTTLRHAAPRTTHSRRPFFTLPDLPSAPPQTLTASRILSYPTADLYTLISDVDSYSTFVPYCSHSRVTRWTTPPPGQSPDDPNSRPCPAQADLRVGWGGFEETFTSRLRCVPGQSVEAVSGAEIDGTGDHPGGAVFKSLVTRWTVQPLEHNMTAAGNEGTAATKVDLVIRFQFANPLYSAVSAAVSDKVAGVMVEAFEKRARWMLGAPRSSLTLNGNI